MDQMNISQFQSKDTNANSNSNSNNENERISSNDPKRMFNKRKIVLKLKNGAIFHGYSFGASPPVGGVSGEVVFTTGMVGYPESLSDPSYRNQLLVFTYPLIGNYGVPSMNEKDEYGLPLYFESDRVQAKAVIVNEYTDVDSELESESESELESELNNEKNNRRGRHWKQSQTLGKWLFDNNVVGITGIDTRKLTEILRDNGTMQGIISSVENDEINIDPLEMMTIVNQVSSSEMHSYGNKDSTLKVTVVDCGLKYNQLRILLQKGAYVTVVPHNFDINAIKIDRLFISNGPGDPEDCKVLIKNLSIFMEKNPTIPIFGICLGHQILSLASGAKTYKLKYGNRGHNIPCQLVGSEKCYITSQNHGYAVDESTMLEGWKPFFRNMNDGSNEGIYHETKPYFSVQFHPEAKAGPEDTMFLFDIFLGNNSVINIESVCFVTPTKKKYEKVLILGSGGLCIGQSGEFDYSGSQAIKAYKEENMTVILVNPNIATVQTSPDFVDKVYFDPVTPEYVEKIIAQERPDCIALSFGGQTALNCGSALYLSGVLSKYNVDVLGTSVESIMKTEDRDVFKQHIKSLNECIPDGAIASTKESAIESAEIIGYPVLVRAAYALGGLGSGFANNRSELLELLQLAFANSNQVIIDKSLRGWKEIEYEIVRDIHGNCLSVCNMENIDPLGVHTGESIVVAPSQTLDDEEYNMLRSVALKVVNSLNIVGECNIQYALDPHSSQYYIIEMNARLSRSSALASKATGYPLAYIAAKLSLGYSLSDLKNAMTKTTSAFFEPSLDYCVIKIPRWDLDKFGAHVTNKIDSAMKSVGEGMAIARTFEEALQKALRMTGLSTFGFEPNLIECNEEILRYPTYKRILAIATGLYSNIYGSETETINKIHEYSNIDMWFLKKFKKITDQYHELENYIDNVTSDIGNMSNMPNDNDKKCSENNNSDCDNVVSLISKEKVNDKIYSKYLNSDDISDSNTNTNINSSTNIPCELLYNAKKLGFSDKQIAQCCKSTELVIRDLRKKYNIYPAIKRIDTVAGEFPCQTNYLYTTYKDCDFSSLAIDEDHSYDHVYHTGKDNRIIVLGSGVYKIGSSVEFDWCSVSCIRELRKLGKEVIMINCNPETVSTDYDEADKLYFEELSFETVMDIFQIEQSTKKISGVIVSVGGQIPNNIAMDLHHQHVPIIGTSPEMIDKAENRHHFSRMLDKIHVDQPLWSQLTSLDDAIKFCSTVGYPCLVRPSYVLSGAAMNVAFSDKDLKKYLAHAVAINKDYPVVISKFISDAKEIEVDAVADAGIVKLMAISEHVENAGVHSGDATLILPAQDLTSKTVDMITQSTYAIAKQLKIHGPFNIQFIAKDDQVKVIECNLRVSRSLPFVSKTLSVNFVEIATRIMCGEEYNTQQHNPKEHIIGIKASQFSFNRLKGADILLDVEMKSTGEVACFGTTKYEAYLKAMIATGFVIPKLNTNVLLSIGTFKFKNEFLQTAKVLEHCGFNIYSTHNTCGFLNDAGITNTEMRLYSKNDIDDNTIFKYIAQKKFSLIINISERNKIRSEDDKNTDGYKLRRLAVECGIPIVTDIKCAKLLVSSLEWLYSKHYINNEIPVRPEVDCFTQYKVLRLPGFIDVHVHVREPGDEYKEDWESCTKSAVAGGITMIFAMPNTNPSIVDESSLSLVEKLSSEKAYCDYGLYLGAGNSNTQTINKLSDRAVGLKMYLNATYGPLLLDNTLDWIEHVKNWPTDRVICVHAESKTLAAILHIGSLFRKHIHVCHVSNKEEIEIIKYSKIMGQRVTCEVSPHHLFLSDGDINHPFDSVKPPLGLSSDCEALWDNMEIIDCFATDHAPHSKSDKTGKGDSSGKREHKCCPGFPGLETALPLLLTAVKENYRGKNLTIDDIILRYHTNPKKIFNIPDQHDTYIDVDMDSAYIIGPKPIYSKCDWTPFSGRKVYGKVKRVVIRGKIVAVDGKIVAEGPFGQNVKGQFFANDQILQSKLQSKSHLQSELESKSHLQSQLQSQLQSSQVQAQSLELRVETKSQKKKQSQVFQELSEKIKIRSDVSEIDRLRKQLKLHHIISAAQFDRESLRTIFELTDIFKKLVEQNSLLLLDILRGKTMAAIFYEPSTRTRCSFAAAMQKLGGNVIDISSDISSVQKGETLEDFVRCMQCYADVLVLRSNVNDSARKASDVIEKPLINAGDGSGEHPTQAILDMYTIREEMGTTGGNICVTLYGDLKYGRTVHSLCKLLALRPKEVRLRFVSPECLKMPDDIKTHLKESGVEFSEHNKLEDVIEKSDVLYVTRIQKERLTGTDGALLTAIETTNITPQLLYNAKKSLRIMHPLPRVNEISAEIDSDPRAAYFRQMQYGLYVRMALLALVI